MATSDGVLFDGVNSVTSASGGAFGNDAFDGQIHYARWYKTIVSDT